MLERLDASAIGFHGFSAGQEVVSGKSIGHVDEIPEMADPFEGLLQNDFHTPHSFDKKVKEITDLTVKSQFRGTANESRRGLGRLS
jgi:hypothetical protein